LRAGDPEDVSPRISGAKAVPLEAGAEAVGGEIAAQEI
jgi:hypothetical protein